MVTSYIVLKDRLKIFADNHYQIKKFGGEFQSEINNFATENEKYPILYISPINQRVYENTTEFDMDLYVMDLIDDDRSNINTIVSDTNLILNDLYNYYKDGYDDAIDVIGNPSLSPLNNQLLDYAAGWVMRITFTVNNYTACSIPFIDGIPYVVSNDCQTSSFKYLTCETVTGCTSLQQYIQEQIDAASGTTVTGFTYDSSNNTLTIGFSDSTTLYEIISEMSGMTFNGPVSATTYYGDGSNLTGISTQDTFVTGGTYFTGGTIVFDYNVGGGFQVNGLTEDLDAAIAGLAETDELTIELDIATNKIRLKNDVAAPPSGTRIFQGNVEFVGNVTGSTFYGDGSNLTGVYPSTNPSGFTSNTGTVTSVGLSMPSAFTVTNSPVISAGTLTVVGAGLTSQYVRGDGSLANFPASTGGGASLSFYLNGSVSQGTFGGISFREMDRTPILGAGTNFTINANGYIQSFITDAGVPNLLEIPAGNWNFETYFSASSAGGSPSFYIELYKWDGTTLSLIASNSTTPEVITNGTVTDLYITALAVPQTTLLTTDRLAVRIYVNHSGRVITLHTEDNHLCQVITTFSTGITALNGLTTQIQNFSVGTSGTDFTINSTIATHTFNLPTASATNRGALSSTDWSTFNGKQNALVSGTNIKTIEGQSILGSGNIDLTKSDVGLGNVDNTSDLNKPISTATQTALNGKENTLGFTPVTNARTISTTSPLSGGGDLTANRTLSISQANTSTDGYLSSTDWNTFNNKLSATITSPTGGDTLQYNNSTSLWENSHPYWTIDLMDNSSVNFYTSQNNVKINSITNVVGSPTITIADDGVAYTLGNTIAIGSKITVTSNIASVIKLNITY